MEQFLLQVHVRRALAVAVYYLHHDPVLLRQQTRLIWRGAHGSNGTSYAFLVCI